MSAQDLAAQSRKSLAVADAALQSGDYATAADHYAMASQTLRRAAARRQKET